MNVEDLGEYTCDGQMNIEDLEKENKPMKTTALMIDTMHLHPHPDNPRKDVGDVTELAKSVKANGIMQNLTVFPMDDELKEYMVLIGHRRLAAAKLAGIYKVPCNVIYEDIPSRAKQIEIMLEENMQRNDLTPMEEADSFQLCLDLGETVEDIQSKTGFSVSTIRHRLEIAKLDKKAMKNHKTEDGVYQLSLTDLYALEKVPDVAKRNEILATAGSPQQLRMKVEEEVSRMNMLKREEELTIMCIGWGLEKLPQRLESQIYSNKVDNVMSINLTNPLPKNIQKPEAKPHHGNLYYVRRYNSFNVYAEVKKRAEKEMTPAQAKEKEKDAAIRKLRAVKKECLESMRLAVMSIITGKVKQPKSVTEWDLLNALWRIVRKRECTIMSQAMWSMHDYGYGEDWYQYGSTEEGRKNRDREIEELGTLPITRQIMLCLLYAFKNTELWTYYGKAKESETEWIQDFVTILMQFGYVPSKEHRQLICGTHELYIKEEQ